MMKRTKIISTLGPATNNNNILKRILQEGVDVIRLNGSHYRNKENIKEDIELIRKVSDELNKHTAIFLISKVPKLESGHLRMMGLY